MFIRLHVQLELSFLSIFLVARPILLLSPFYRYQLILSAFFHVLSINIDIFLSIKYIHRKKELELNTNIIIPYINWSGIIGDYKGLIDESIYTIISISNKNQ